jgi:hypothetical protein
MLKKLFGLLLFIAIYTTTNASTSSLPNESNTIQSLAKLHKFKVKTVNELEYWWVLHNDGCYRLYRVEVIGGIFEIWTPLNHTNYIGSTINCVYTQEQMDVMC